MAESFETHHHLPDGDEDMTMGADDSLIETPKSPSSEPPLKKVQTGVFTSSTPSIRDRYLAKPQVADDASEQLSDQDRDMPMEIDDHLSRDGDSDTSEPPVKRARRSRSTRPIVDPESSYYEDVPAVEIAKAKVTAKKPKAKPASKRSKSKPASKTPNLKETAEVTTNKPKAKSVSKTQEQKEAIKAKAKQKKLEKQELLDLELEADDNEISINAAADENSNDININKYSKPITDIKDIFWDIVKRALRTGKADGLEHFIKYLKNKPIHIATICSGTESPIIAIMLIKQVLAKFFPDLALNFEHLFSAEIVAFKQHYIEANFAPPILFSDVTELSTKVSDGEERTATTAYGGKQVVPGDVDLLVAGFSCVDFSPLNCRPKSLEQLGESGDTFFALRAYALEHRPRIIILENVAGAPWEHGKVKNVRRSGLDLLMGQIGYATAHVRVDTKRYYLPQTRVRGYMVCIDKMLYLPPNQDLKKFLAHWEKYPIPGWIFDEETKLYTEEEISSDTFGFQEELAALDADLRSWQNLVHGLSRKASVPIDMLLLRSDDPSLEALSTQTNHTSKTAVRKVTPWERARIMHAEYRDGLRLGHKRALLDWINGGVHVPEDHWKRGQKGMVDRVLDTLEICHIRSLARGFDNRYYPRPLELSQNVFRVFDTTQPGIIGCLTPTGFPFMSDRGSRVIGLESMITQGLHLEELDLAMLSQANLQDLAGNAMSSPVVGVAMVAAFCVFHIKLNVEHRKPIARRAAIAADFFGEKLLWKHSKISSDHINTLSCTEAMAEALTTLRMCACEGRLHHKSTEFQRCKICRHTTCKQCGVKPQHCYEDVSQDELSRRKDPGNFEKLIRSSIPTSTSFYIEETDLLEFEKRIQAVTPKTPQNVPAMLPVVLPAKTSKVVPGKQTATEKMSEGVTEKTTEDDIENALANEAEKEAEDDKDAALDYFKMVKLAFGSNVFLRTVRRDEFWEIIYDSPTARLILVISGQHIEWRLFANVDDRGLDSLKGKYYRKHPIAKMIPEGDNIMGGDWKLWVPEEREFIADMRWMGSPLKSFGNERGLLDMLGDYVYPDCELSVKEYDASFFEQEVNGHYTLSQACSQPQNTLHARQPRTSKDGRPLFFYLDQNIQHGRPEDHHFFGFTQDTHKLEKYEHRNILAEFGEEWRPPYIKINIPLEDKDLTEPSEESESMPADDKIPTNKGKKTALALRKPDVEADKLDDVKDTFLQHGKIISRGRWETSSILSMNYVEGTELMYRVLPSTTVALPAESLCTSENLAVFCFEGTLATEITIPWVDGGWTVISQANESRFMADFGWAFKQGSVIAGHTNEDIDWKVEPNTPHCSTCAPPPPPLLWTLTGKIGKVPTKATPCEEPRAATRHERAMKDRPRGLLAQFSVNDGGYVQFKVGANPLTLLHRASALLSSSQSKAGALSKITTSWRLVTDDESNPNVKYALLTVIQNTDCPEGIEVTGFLFKLRPEQKRALVWMKGRDDGREPFKEEEVVEDRLLKLRYRLEGKASRNVFCRGGLLFFDVGFGKTAITLALVKSCLESDKNSSLSLLSSRPPAGSGKVPIKATVIVVPSHLTKQWQTEIEKFLGWKAKTAKKEGQVLVIHTAYNLQKLTVEDFTKANIIILNWKVLASKSYQDGLAKLGGIVESVTTPTALRAKTLWYEKATSNIAETVKSLEEDGVTPKDVWDRLIARLRRDTKLCDVANAPIPTKRTRGKNYVAAVERGVKRKADELEDSRSDEIEDSKSDEESENEDNADEDSSNAESIPKGKAKVKKVKAVDHPFDLLGAAKFMDMKFPLLEIFQFARVVIDEFTYLFNEPHVLHMVNNLAAPSKFALSGTPDLARFTHVKKLANILGIHLGRDDYESMKSEEFSLATKDMSKSEHFLTYQSASSTAWHINRQGVAQNFLNIFARKDEADVDGIECEKIYHLIELDAAQKAVYLELQQRVASSTFDNLRSRNVDSAVERQIQEVSWHNDPKGTLLVRASHMKLESEDQKGAMIEPSNDKKKKTPKVKSEYDNCLVKDLKQKLKDRNLSDKGLKPVLISRLIDDDQKDDKEVSESDSETSEDDEAENEAEPTPEAPEVVVSKMNYRSKPVEDLIKQLSGRGILHSASIKKSDAVKKLNEADRLDAVENTPDIPLEAVSVQGLIAIRRTQYHNFKLQIALLLKKAFWLKNHEDTQTAKPEPPKNFTKWISRVKNNGFNDQDCETDISALIDTAESEYSEDDWEEFYFKDGISAAEKVIAENNGKLLYPQGLNDFTNTKHLKKSVAFLRTACTQLSRDMETLVSHRRSMRLMEAISAIASSSSRCSKCDQKLALAKNVTILSACGHVLCRGCKTDIGDACPLNYCKAENRPFEQVSGSEFHDLAGAEESSNSRKIDAIIVLIMEAIASGGKVLLFVQFPRVAADLKLTMKKNKIRFADMINQSTKATTLQQFQNPDSPYTVLMLDPIGAAAAGSNLTCCDNIIFTSPLYIPGYNAQYKYVATDTQAIGRARRYGQLKKVKVHYMLSVNTIDVDLFQHREGKILCRDPQDDTIGVLIDGVESTLHSSIRHINFPGAPMTD